MIFSVSTCIFFPRLINRLCICVYAIELLSYRSYQLSIVREKVQFTPFKYSLSLNNPLDYNLVQFIPQTMPFSSFQPIIQFVFLVSPPNSLGTKGFVVVVVIVDSCWLIQAKSPRVLHSYIILLVAFQLQSSTQGTQVVSLCETWFTLINTL